MPLYRYVKQNQNQEKPPRLPPQKTMTLQVQSLDKRRRLLGFLPFFLIIIGLGLSASVVYPVFSYQFFTTLRFQPKFLSPLADSADLYPLVLGETRDLTKVSNWYPERSEPIRPSSKVTHYTISISKLKIFEATVKIGGEDLKESLIHYGGAALPGEFGNTVVFGHSVLPHFFNPKNYLTIFSTLPTLEGGDEVFVNFDGVEYKYKVYEMVEVKPDDMSILEQQYDNSYLTLVTCVPPGTYWRRLAVRARLEEI